MATQAHRSLEELAELAQRLPTPILQDACANDPLPLAELFAYEEARILPFGERLIMTAGLCVAALYVARVERDVVDARLPIIIRPLLMSRSYSTGMAISILQRLPVVGPALGIPWRSDWSCVSRFLEIRGATYGNTWRALHQESLEDLFWAVLEYLGFLRDLTFSAKPDIARIGGRTIPLWPFLHWDGRVLCGLRESRLVGRRDEAGSRLPNRLLFAREDVLLDPPQVELVSDLSLRQTARLAHVAKRVGLDVPTTTGDVSIDSESFVAVLADNYSRMQKLLDLFDRHADQATREAWVAEYLGKDLRVRPDPVLFMQQVAAKASDRATLDNAILALCLERDPVAVLTEYFIREPNDQLTCLRELDDQNGPQLYRAAVQQGDALRSRIAPLYVGTDEPLKIAAERHQAREVAFEVARLLKFRIRNVAVRDAIEDHAQRLKAFLVAMVERPDEDRINLGLAQCCKIAEEVLSFVQLFHLAARTFDPTSSHGLSLAARSELRETAGLRIGLGGLIRTFHDICDEYSTGGGVRWLGRRRQLLKDAAPHLQTLNALNDVRNDQLFHGERVPGLKRRVTAAEGLKLLDGILEFFEWLRSPYPERRGTADRIFPAVLHLNVLTVNRCGVTSVRYVLRERGDDEIRLYTQQPVSSAAGVFYGLPVEGKGNAELWVDPILFAADDFEASCGGKEEGEPP